MSLHYRELGTRGRPVVVALHGFLGTGENWAEIADQLRGDFHFIIPDLPGHGKSTVRPVDFERCLDTLEDWAQRVGIGEAHLLGYSMGGRLALGWALRHPGRWRSLVLEGASPGIAASAAQAERAALDDGRAARLSEAGLSDFLDEWQELPLFESLRRLPPLRRAKLRGLRERSNAEGLAWAVATLGPGRQPSYWDALRHLDLPVHLIVGALDEKFREIASRMAGLIPHAQVHTLPGCGHCAHFEQPERYAALLTQILHARRTGAIAC